MKDYHKALEYEIFTKEEYRFAKDRIKTAKTILDIGGHIGLFSLRCLQLNPQATIHYFEPFPQLVEEAKIRLSPFSEQVHIHPYAIANTAGETTFLRNPHKTMQSSRSPSFLNPRGQSQPITCRTLSPILEQLESVDVMKLDVEGMEFEILDALTDLERKKIKSLICEIHLTSDEAQSHFKALKAKIASKFAHADYFPSPYTEKILLLRAYTPNLH